MQVSPAGVSEVYNLSMIGQMPIDYAITVMAGLAAFALLVAILGMLMEWGSRARTPRLRADTFSHRHLPPNKCTDDGKAKNRPSDQE